MIWILSEVYYPEETGTGYYITQIAEHLASNQPVSVLCAQPAYSQASVKALRTETRRSVKIYRCPSIVLHGQSILARLIRMISMTISMSAAALLRIKSGDSILGVTNPPSVPILTALLSFVLRARFSLVVHDVYPDIMAACGVTSPNSIPYKVLQRINKWVLRRATHIFCIGRDMREHLARVRDTGTSDGIEVIPLWADCDVIHPTPRDSNQLLKELGLANQLIVLYAGNMSYPHDIETLAKAIKILEQDDDVHFLFIGTGHKRKLLNEMLTHGSRNITVLSPLPRSAQNEFLNACDVAIISLVPGMLGLAVPSRTYNLMAAGKPIIALVAENSEVARVIREERIGWVVEPGAVEMTVEAIQSAKRLQSELHLMSIRARRAAETKYLPQNVLSRYEAIIQPQ